MALRLVLRDPNKWQLVYEENFRANVLLGRVREPIPPILVPVILQNPVLLVVMDNQKAKATWERGAYLYPIVTVGNPFGEVDCDRQLVRVNKAKLITFPRFAENYKVRLEVLPWHDEADFVIYEYTGEGLPEIGDVGNTAVVGEQPNFSWLTR